ncbi:MAG: putative transglutaminase-like cysteine proteinase [Verrucomicrobiales bacterium]|jgi:predicted transglutaminase-like cysteine proteinase
MCYNFHNYGKMKLLTYSSFIGLILGFCYLWVLNHGKNLASNRTVEFADTASFSELLRFQVNLGRHANRLPVLNVDKTAEQWVESKLPEVMQNSTGAMDSVLEGLQASMPTVHTAAAYLTLADTEHELIRQVVQWQEGIGQKATHLVTLPFKRPGVAKLGCFAVSMRKLPEFSPELLDQQVELFFNTCPHCKASHAGKVPPSGRSIVFSCPHCDKPFDAYAIDNNGRYSRVTSFLSHFEGPELDPAPTTRIEEMYCVWYAVATRCRYTSDISGVNGPRDYWQNSMETFTSRIGDCEDSSILLADWLISRGIEAKVATGKTKDGEGHAWCVARIDGVQYILETTALPDPENPPLADELRNEYQPRYLFDRYGIYFLADERNSEVSDYWGKGVWLSLMHSGVKTYENQSLIAGDRGN